MKLYKEDWKDIGALGIAIIIIVIFTLCITERCDAEDYGLDHGLDPSLQAAIGRRIHLDLQTDARYFAMKLTNEIRDEDPELVAKIRVRSIRTVIEPVLSMPAPPITSPERGPVIAYTTITPAQYEAGGCTIHITVDYATDMKTIAHEVCHCVLHHDLIGAAGWKAEVGRSLIPALEDGAYECADELVGIVR